MRMPLVTTAFNRPYQYNPDMFPAKGLFQIMPSTFPDPKTQQISDLNQRLGNQRKALRQLNNAILTMGYRSKLKAERIENLESRMRLDAELFEREKAALQDQVFALIDENDRLVFEHAQCENKSAAKIGRLKRRLKIARRLERERTFVGPAQ